MGINDIGNNYNNYNNQLNQTNSTLNKIATGLEINKASDNGAGLAIATQLMAEGNALSQAIDNTGSGIAMLNIADGAMREQSSILDEVNQKLIQASSSTTDDAGREMILKDIQGLMKSFNEIGSSTNYNGTTLLQQSDTDKNASNALAFQSATDGETNVTMEGIQSNTTGVGLDGLLNQDPSTFTADAARDYLELIGSAQDTLNDYSSDIGSTTNQLISSMKNLMSERTATEAAKSVIMDTDYAKESANFSAQNVISQAGAYSIAQANTTQQSVLKLLQ